MSFLGQPTADKRSISPRLLCWCREGSCWEWTDEIVETPRWEQGDSSYRVEPQCHTVSLQADKKSGQNDRYHEEKRCDVRPGRRLNKSTSGKGQTCALLLGGRFGRHLGAGFAFSGEARLLCENVAGPVCLSV